MVHENVCAEATGVKSALFDICALSCERAVYRVCACARVHGHAVSRACVCITCEACCIAPMRVTSRIYVR